MNKIIKIFNEYERIKSKIEIPSSKMKEDILRFSDGVCLYGAGSAGIAFLYYLKKIGIVPRFFVDQNEKRWKELCEGIEIIAPEDVVDKTGPDVLVIVTINTDGKRYCKSFDEELRREGHEGVYKMLKNAGVKNIVDYTFFRRTHDIFQGDQYNLPSCSDVYLMEKHKDDIKQVYGWLSDEKSKRIFLDIVRFRMIDDSLTIESESQDNQYFEKELFDFSDEESFVDCGAYNGISLNSFLNRTNGIFKQYYGFEPDEKNYKLLSERIDSLPEQSRNKCKIFNNACYDTHKKINLYSLGGPGSFVADIGKEKVDALTIDQVTDNGTTYIKMNIEGSEIPALLGAKATIMRDKPKLAIAGYHKTRDLWEIPKIIKGFVPDYKLYLRSYMNHISFVYYAKV